MIHFGLATAQLLRFLPVAVFAALVTGLICHFAMPIAAKLGLLDRPSRKPHGNHLLPTPLLGGIAIILPQIIVNMAGDAFASMLVLSGSWPVYPSFAVVLGVLLLVGALDDRLGLSAILRLIVKAAVFVVVMLLYPAATIQHVNFPLLGREIQLGYLALPATVLCAVVLVNAINMTDGRNGLVIGISIIWSFALLLKVQDYVVFGLVMLIASLLIAFAYNMRGKLFLGDAGTYGLGGFFALMAVGVHNADPAVFPSAQVACLFAIPLLDMIRLIILRLKRRRSPMAADREHLHHYLDRRFGWDLGLPIYLAMTALPIAIAWTGPKMGFLGLVAALVIYLGVAKAVRAVPVDLGPSVPGE